MVLRRPRGVDLRPGIEAAPVIPDTFPGRAALHSSPSRSITRGRGVGAVMVGAGFSRRANRAAPATPLPPLWKTLEAGLVGELYGDRKDPAVPMDAPMSFS